MKQKIRLGAGSGFWGDGIDPALELLDRGELDYLCFDFLAELTMALLQRQKLKNPQLGYVPDAVQYMKEMMPLARKRGTRLVSNGGGVNSRAAAQRIAEDARALGLDGMRVALVEGDNLLDKQYFKEVVPILNNFTVNFRGERRTFGIGGSKKF